MCRAVCALGCVRGARALLHAQSKAERIEVLAERCGGDVRADVEVIAECRWSAVERWAYTRSEDIS